MISEAVIKMAVREFETGLRMMVRDNTGLHAFDLGKAKDGTMYSVLITIAPQFVIDSAIPGRPRLSRPLDPVPCEPTGTDEGSTGRPVLP